MSHFVTTSDILNRLNESLEDVGSFQLHTKLPDGSARVSTKSEQAAADFGAKLEQAAAYVQALPQDKRLEWADAQRIHGNELYAKKLYEEAIDVYLTCLTVAGGRDSAIYEDAERLELFFKTMNNLAVCTLQLKWYRKTIEFCTTALQEQLIGDDSDKTFMFERAKLYFKRAKAGRLRGDYCVEDIEKAKTCLEQSSQGNDPDLQKAINKEQRLLQQAIARAEVNQAKQAKSMKRLLAPNETYVEPLYDSRGEREYSLIRAPKDKIGTPNISDGIDTPKSYMEMYIAIIQRQVQRWMKWWDDREAQKTE